MLTADDDAYTHIKENLFGDITEIIGSEGKQQTDTNLLFWSYDNWIEGNGLALYDEDQPARWKLAFANTRRPGRLQAMPDRSDGTITTSISSPTFGGFVQVGGRLWYFTGDQGFFSTNQGSSWTENTDVATELPASYQITAVTTDGEYPYFAASDGTNRGIWRCDSTTVATDVVTAHANAAEYLGIAVREGRLYAWTGNILFIYPLEGGGGTLPITHSAATHRKYRVANEAPVETLIADVKADEDTTVMMRTYDGHTEFHEWRLDPQTNQAGPNQFWTLAEGFTGTHFCIHAGTIFVAGEYQDELALWAYSLKTRQPFFLGYLDPEAGAKDSIEWIAPSYGAQIMVGVQFGSGHVVYVYDAEEDAFSILGLMAAGDGVMKAGVTSGNRRIAASVDSVSGTTTNIARWESDFSSSVNALSWESPEFDFNFPHEEKILLGFHVVQDGSIAAADGEVFYKLDGDTSWTSAGTFNNTNPRHTYIPVTTGSTTKKFRTLRIQVTGADGPIIFSVTARAYLNTRKETWRLKLKLTDLASSSRRPTNLVNDSDKLRDYLHTIVNAGNAVTFQDGRRYKKRSSTANVGYTEHTVLVQFPRDTIDSMSEGTCEVILRSIDPSA